jgi:pyruvate carboxylase subunit B
MKKKIRFMLTALRDGFQSVYGARVFSRDFLPVVAAAREAGIEHIEAGGGAMFQSAYFYSNEDAFIVMDEFRKEAGPDANLQSLARGVTVVALDSQPSDIIKLHAQLFKKHGVTTVRNFDALNDVDNLIYSGRCITEAGLRHEVSVSMMELPPGCEGAHTPDFYIGVLKKILKAEIPYTSICFKDASGTASPKKVYDTIKLARKLVGDATVLTFHSHETAGNGTVCYKAAIEAGIDGVDLSMAPVSGGTCQPDILTLWHTLRGTDYDLDIDVNKIIKLEAFFKDCMKDYFIPPEATMVEPLIPFFPMPGGALTANTQMLRDYNLMDRYPEIIAAMGETVAKGGFGTSVTPVSQFYFQQAFNNVMFGPWEQIAEGYGKMVLGYFGKTPVNPDPEVIKIAQKQLGIEPTSRSVLEINDRDPKKGVAATKKLLEENKLPVTDENIFIVSCCQEKGIEFLRGEGKIGVRKKQAEAKQG